MRTPLPAMTTGFCADRMALAAASTARSSAGGGARATEGRGGEETGRGTGSNRTRQRIMCVEHRYRSRLPGERMFDRKLGGLHRTNRVMRLHHVLGDAAERASRIPAPPIASRLLVRRMQCEA